jgi:tetratricopeptide (TPR) repeat protein
MQTLRKSFILVALLATSFHCYCQSSNEVLLLKGEYESILKNTKSLQTADDFLWHSLALEKLNLNLRAIEVLNQGMVLYPSSDLEQMLARQYYETGQYRNAKPLLYKHYNTGDMLFMLVNILDHENNFDDAIGLIKNRLTTDSLNTSLLSHLGSLYYQKKDADSSIYYFNRSLDLNPHDQGTSKKLANVLLKKKQYDQAIDVCDKILADDSTLVKFINIKALCNFKKDNFELAKKDYTYLIQRGDSNLTLLKNLGICELNVSEFQKSRELLLKAFQLDSSDVEICFYLGKGFYNSMTPEIGIDFFNRSESLLRPDPLLLSLICIEKGAIYRVIGDHATAIECYKQAYQYNHDPKYKFYIAGIYQNKLNKREMALKYYETFLSEVNANNIIDLDQLSATEQSYITLARQNISVLKKELFFEQ